MQEMSISTYQNNHSININWAVTMYPILGASDVSVNKTKILAHIELTFLVWMNEFTIDICTTAKKLVLLVFF